MTCLTLPKTKFIRPDYTAKNTIREFIMNKYGNSSYSKSNATSRTGSIDINNAKLLSDDVVYYLDIFLNCFLIHVLCLFGILGNIINIIVLSYQGARDSNIILFSLAFTDLFMSVCKHLRRLKCLVATVDTPLSITVDTIGYVFIYPLDNWCLGLTLFQITAIAVERCLAVCAPFSVSSIFTVRLVKLMIVSLCVYTAVIMAPILYRLSYTWENDVVYNVTVARLTYTQFYLDNKEFVDQVTSVVYGDMCTMGPLVTILICSLIIISKLAQQRPNRLQKLTSLSRSSNKRVRDKKSVKMLLIVCLTTVVSCLPTTVIVMFFCLLVRHRLHPQPSLRPQQLRRHLLSVQLIGQLRHLRHLQFKVQPGL
ncbi:hypothetical protein Btru_046948 [Bulinus truncatus]|nr:hypothetical protein Btru_046948 [Bulinus truncatus]